MKKKCIRCGVEKPLEEFYNNFAHKDFYSSICKECQLQANKDWAEKNKERKRELNRLYYQRKKAQFKGE